MAEGMAATGSEEPIGGGEVAAPEEGAPAEGPGPPPTTELRLALAMRGGVSLAVWIGGACAEIDEVRRSHGDPTGLSAVDATGRAFWRELLEATGHTGVTVDVMAGASAGGLNGVLFAASIRYGFPMSGLIDVWEQVADIARLRRWHEPLALPVRR